MAPAAPLLQQQAVHLRQCSLAGSRLRSSPVSAQAPRRLPSRQHLQTVAASGTAAPVALETRSLDGSVTGSVDLALTVADPETAKGLAHRYLVTVMQNARQGTASTKTRAEVAGGGRKPYKQKGTGNARIGSTRTPLRPGGGVSFGPKPTDWTIKMNTKERRLAMATALQSAAADMVVVEDLKGKLGAVPKTRDLVAALDRLGVSVADETALLILNEWDDQVVLAGRNVAKLSINSVDSLNVYNVLRADKVVVEQSALAYLQQFFGQPAASA